MAASPPEGSVTPETETPIVRIPAATRSASAARPSRSVPASAAAPQNLLDDDRAGHPAPADPFRRVRVRFLRGRVERDVVGDEHGPDLVALGAGEIGTEPEVEDVAGVVLDDEQHPGAAVDRVDRRLHLHGARAREHFTGTRRGEQPGADEPGMHGLVARAAAGDERDQAGSRQIGAGHVAGVEGGAQPAAGSQHQAGDRVVDQLIRIGDDVARARHRRLLPGGRGLFRGRSRRCRAEDCGDQIGDRLGAGVNVALTAPGHVARAPASGAQRCGAFGTLSGSGQRVAALIQGIRHRDQGVQHRAIARFGATELRDPVGSRPNGRRDAVIDRLRRAQQADAPDRSRRASDARDRVRGGEQQVGIGSRGGIKRLLHPASGSGEDAPEVAVTGGRVELGIAALVRDRCIAGVQQPIPQVRGLHGQTRRSALATFVQAPDWFDSKVTVSFVGLAGG